MALISLKDRDLGRVVRQWISVNPGLTPNVFFWVNPRLALIGLRTTGPWSGLCWIPTFIYYYFNYCVLTAFIRVMNSARFHVKMCRSVLLFKSELCFQKHLYGDRRVYIGFFRCAKHGKGTKIVQRVHVSLEVLGRHLMAGQKNLKSKWKFELFVIAMQVFMQQMM